MAHWPAAAVLASGEEGCAQVLMYMIFAAEHWSRLNSTIPLDQLDRLVKWQMDVVGIFPNTEAVLHLVGSVFIATHDECQAEAQGHGVRTTCCACSEGV